MSISQDVVSLGGSYTDDGQAWIVSYWHIPGGCDYVNASAEKVFFENKEDAGNFTNKYEMLPHMAFMMSREDYLKIQSHTELQID